MVTMVSGAAVFVRTMSPPDVLTALITLIALPPPVRLVPPPDVVLRLLATILADGACVIVLALTMPTAPLADRSPPNVTVPLLATALIELAVIAPSARLPAAWVIDAVPPMFTKPPDCA